MQQVLIVDDSVSARFALKRALEPHQLSVAEAKSAEEGLESLQTLRPRVIFMDHVLPAMDGLQAVEAIRQMPEVAATPIIMCSSNDGEDYIAEAKARGADAVMRKPPDPARLAQLLEQHLHAASSAPSPEPAAQAAVEPPQAAAETAAPVVTAAPAAPQPSAPAPSTPAPPPAAPSTPAPTAPAPVATAAAAPDIPAAPPSASTQEAAMPSSDDQLAALDARIAKVEALLQRLETTVGQMDAKVAAQAKIVADHAGRELSNRLLRAVITLKGSK